MNPFIEGDLAAAARQAKHGDVYRLKSAGREKAAIKFHASDWGAIKLALAQYVSTLP